MKALKLLGFGLIGYLCGSVSFGRVIGRMVAPELDMTDTTLAMPGGAEIEYPAFDPCRDHVPESPETAGRTSWTSPRQHSKNSKPHPRESIPCQSWTP